MYNMSSHGRKYWAAKSKHKLTRRRREDIIYEMETKLKDVQDEFESAIYLDRKKLK